MCKIPEGMFEIHTFDPYSGWDTQDRLYTTEEVCKYLRDFKNKTLMVLSVEGELVKLVYKQGDPDADLHSAWVQRTPR